MPLLNESYWKDRIGTATPSRSGMKWLDWCHERVIVWTLRRLWAELNSPRRVLEVGCADGRWTAWMQRYLSVKVMGVDAIEYPHIRKTADLFVQCDPEELDKCREARRFRPDVLLYMNSLTCTDNWRRAVQAGAHVAAPYVICFDNFMAPTPPWMKNLPHRQPIELPALEATWRLHGYRVRQEVAGDWFHRKLFLTTPKWSHPAVAAATLGLDWVASYVLTPDRARHVAVLFKITTPGIST